VPEPSNAAGEQGVRPADGAGRRSRRGAGKPTIKDVAAHAGVSPMTASRVVNGHGQVRADLRDRVLEAVSALGYRRNAAATSLRRSDGAPWTIALILQDAANPFSAQLQRAVEDVARTADSFVLTASTDEDRDRMESLLDAVSSRDVDGVLLAPPPGDQSHLTARLRPGMPLVLVDRPAEGIDAPAVLSDNESGMRQATAHLLGHGHRRIAYLGDLRSAPMRLRFDGFRAALADAGLEAGPEQLGHSVETAEEGERAVRALLTGPRAPTALLAARNALTIGAVRALHALKAQHHVALVGFDDLELAGELDPGLTVVAQDPAVIGHTAATTLLHRMRDPAAQLTGRLVPTRLIPRGSGELTRRAG